MQRERGSRITERLGNPLTTHVSRGPSVRTHRMLRPCPMSLFLTLTSDVMDGMVHTEVLRGTRTRALRLPTPLRPAPCCLWPSPPRSVSPPQAFSEVPSAALSLSFPSHISDLIPAPGENQDAGQMCFSFSRTWLLAGSALGHHACSPCLWMGALCDPVCGQR